MLVHDHVRHDALVASLRAMAADASVKVVPIEAAVRRKFGCSPAAVYAAMRAAGQ